MDVCKCIVLLQHPGTLNNCQAASPLVRLMEREGKGSGWPLITPELFFLQIWLELSQIILLPLWCSKATADDRLTNSPLPRCILWALI
ncbi:hypothetical protein TNCV_2241441 [Trichonephila clavipes]|nr:hypothetical protein TNCV_2241441 [Trichonephila clavipes]